VGIARRGTAAALGLGLAGCDWPQYLAGPHHTSFNRFEHGIGRGNVGDLEVAWTAPTPSATAPAVVDGVVYLDGNAVDAETGAPVAPGGPGAFPAVSGRSLLGCGFSDGLAAVDVRTGALRWSAPDTHCGGSGLTVAGGVAYTNAGPPPDFGLAATRVRDGARLWQTLPCADGATSVWTPPVAQGVAYATCAGGDFGEEWEVVAVDARTGRTRWRKPLDTSTIGATPAVDGGRLFVVGGTVSIDGVTRPARIFALDARTGAELWTTTIPGFLAFSAPAVDGRRAYVLDTDGVLRALDVRTGAVVWSATADTFGNFGAPAVANGVVYTAGFTGLVDAFDTRTGERLFHTDLDTQIFGASPVVADGTLYVTTQTAGLYAFRPPG
jgi:outer membrane protein assembly factor BamB